MLRHIIKRERLNILMKFYQNFKDYLSWKLEYKSNIVDSMQTEPCVLVTPKKASSRFQAKITYNITSQMYIVFWSDDEESHARRFIQNYESKYFTEVINNIENILGSGNLPHLNVDDVYELN